MRARAESGERRAESGERRAESGERRAESGERRAESGERRAALRRAPLPPAIYWQTRFRLFLKTVLWRATLATQRATNIYTASG